MQEAAQRKACSMQAIAARGGSNVHAVSGRLTELSHPLFAKWMYAIRCLGNVDNQATCVGQTHVGNASMSEFLHSHNPPRFGRLNHILSSIFTASFRHA